MVPDTFEAIYEMAAQMFMCLGNLQPPSLQPPGSKHGKSTKGSQAARAAVTNPVYVPNFGAHSLDFCLPLPP